MFKGTKKVFDTVRKLRIVDCTRTAKKEIFQASHGL